jgi:multicomponent Na+:H+ antiporter subunit E
MRNWLGILLLTLAWIALTGSWTIPNALLGLALSVLASSFAREQRRRREVALRPLRIAELALLFVYELML